MMWRVLSAQPYGMVDLPPADLRKLAVHAMDMNNWAGTGSKKIDADGETAAAAAKKPKKETAAAAKKRKAAEALEVKELAPAAGAGAYTRPLFQLNVSTFCETRWLVSSLCQ